MKIALLWTKGLPTHSVLPLSLGYLKSNIDNKHNVKIFDFALDNIELEKIVLEFNPQIIGASCWSCTYKETINILDKVKLIEHKIITVVGGIHASLNSDIVMKNQSIDFVFRGEAELNFPKFVDEIQKEKTNLSEIKGLTYRSKNGSIINNEIAWEKDLDKIKIPDYDAMRLRDYIQRGYRLQARYKHNAPIWVSRGCPYFCEYCSVSMHNGRMVRYHSIKYVIEWIKFLYYNKGIRSIGIIDDNFTFNMNYVKQLCREIIKLNLKNLSFGTPNGVRMQHLDKELLSLFKQAGWDYISIAPESGSIKILKKMKKDLDPAIIPEKVKQIKEAGLKANAYFMVGYPNETPEDIKKTIELIRKCKFNFFALFNFQPLPGTTIFKELVEKKEIPLDFLPGDYSSGVKYIPKTLENFNFSLLRLKEYLYLVITNFSSLQYIFTHWNYKMFGRKIFFNLINLLNNKIVQSKKE